LQENMLEEDAFVPDGGMGIAGGNVRLAHAPAAAIQQAEAAPPTEIPNVPPFRGR
jgi:hypothetical protein